MKTTLKVWLKKKGMTVDRFARETGVHFSTVNKWMTGTVPSESLQEKIARTFPDCPIAN